MKSSRLLLMLAVLFACTKPSETLTVTEDTTQVEATAALTSAADETERTGSEKLDRFLADFALSSESLPSISMSFSNSIVNYSVHYFFEDDFLSWAKIKRSEEGAVEEDWLVSRDPEGTFYLHYGMSMDGAWGYAGNDDGEWYTVKTDKDYKPYLDGPGQPDKFEYLTEFEKVMTLVREKRDNFKLKDGFYQLEQRNNGSDEVYRFSEVLFESNLLSPTRFDPKLIEGYLNWYTALYETADGKLYRHMQCGGEYVIMLKLQAGNYRWEEENYKGETIDYYIKGFEESEGDPMYATLERNGTRIRKTLLFQENQDENDNDIIYIDGRPYTSEPKKYDYITLECEETKQ